jgi:hypothetical protein
MQKDIWAACIAGFLLCVGSLSLGTDPLWVTIVIFTLAIAAFAFGWLGSRSAEQPGQTGQRVPADWV